MWCVHSPLLCVFQEMPVRLVARRDEWKVLQVPQDVRQLSRSVLRGLHSMYDIQGLQGLRVRGSSCKYQSLQGLPLPPVTTSHYKAYLYIL